MLRGRAAMRDGCAWMRGVRAVMQGGCARMRRCRASMPRGRAWTGRDDAWPRPRDPRLRGGDAGGGACEAEGKASLAERGGLFGEKRGYAEVAEFRRERRGSSALLAIALCVEDMLQRSPMCQAAFIDSFEYPPRRCILQNKRFHIRMPRPRVRLDENLEATEMKSNSTPPIRHSLRLWRTNDLCRIKLNVLPGQHPLCKHPEVIEAAGIPSMNQKA